MQYFVYVLRSVPTGRHYIGITGDVVRRVTEHNSRNGRWTSSYKPWVLAGVEEYESRSEASQRERFLKSSQGVAERRELFKRFGPL